METVEQIKILEHIAEFGLDDEIVNQTLNKLISYQIQKQQRDFQEVQAKLTSFETQYGVGSNEFYEQFHQGQLGDDEDFFEWDALVHTRNRIKQRMALLNTTK